MCPAFYASGTNGQVCFATSVGGEAEKRDETGGGGAFLECHTNHGNPGKSGAFVWRWRDVLYRCSTGNSREMHKTIRLDTRQYALSFWLALQGSRQSEDEVLRPRIAL